MVKPHKHADAIKAWADGAEIECRSPHGDHWIPTEYPTWLLDVEYRVKPKPHKWQKEMDAQAAGKAVQMRIAHNMPWVDGRGWGFNLDYAEYRIKPEQVVKYAWAHPANAAVGWREVDTANLKLTFEDGKLIKAEVL